MLRWTLPALAGTLLFAGMANAQQPEIYKARLEPNARNVGLCNELDTSLRREHTVTVTGATANVVGSGGVKAAMKQTTPKVYENASVQIGANQFRIVADLSKALGTLDVTDNRLGCRWSGALAR
ncbi:MAG: hypothetical protein K0S54_2050 [Alphaproteobacteria bacterium]|nr:hypothetical protein [Alphaproteobacteria bacterium]